MPNVCALAEVEKVGTAPHRNMLTVIDRFVRVRIFERGCSSAEPSLRLEQLDGLTRLGQCHGRRESGQSTADDSNPRSPLR
jgi:hypothetical protein